MTRLEGGLSEASPPLRLPKNRHDLTRSIAQLQGHLRWHTSERASSRRQKSGPSIYGFGKSSIGALSAERRNGKPEQKPEPGPPAGLLIFRRHVCQAARAQGKLSEPTNLFRCARYGACARTARSANPGAPWPSAVCLVEPIPIRNATFNLAVPKTPNINFVYSVCWRI